MRRRTPSLDARDATILAAFDAGERTRTISTRLGLTKNVVNGVLAKHERRVRKTVTPISHLPAVQQRAYVKMRRHGIAPQEARATAQAVTA
jgi:hypothetical protein